MLVSHYIKFKPQLLGKHLTVNLINSAYLYYNVQFSNNYAHLVTLKNILHAHKKIPREGKKKSLFLLTIAVLGQVK